MQLNSDKITMVGVDGKLRLVPLYMKEELLAQGWGLVTNPKQNYYPQYDKTLKGYGDVPPNIDEDTNYLEIEKI